MSQVDEELEVLLASPLKGPSEYIQTVHSTPTKARSAEARRLVLSGELTAWCAVTKLGEAMTEGADEGVIRACPECGTAYVVHYADADGGRVNTCSDPCQRAMNTAIMDLDDGRTIIRVSELSSERLKHMLGEVGLGVLCVPPLAS